MKVKLLHGTKISNAFIKSPKGHGQIKGNFIKSIELPWPIIVY